MRNAIHVLAQRRVPAKMQEGSGMGEVHPASRLKNGVSSR